MESQEFKTDFEKLKFLLGLVKEMNLYNRKIQIIQRLQEIAAYAHFFQYSFDHWQDTGMWRKYSELTIQTETEITPIPETQTFEKPKTETKQAFEAKRVVSVSKGLISKNCDFCGEEFLTNKPVQRFCPDKTKNCKNNYHNANKI